MRKFVAMVHEAVGELACWARLTAGLARFETIARICLTPHFGTRKGLAGARSRRMDSTAFKPNSGPLMRARFHYYVAAAHFLKAKVQRCVSAVR
jgi:hypothetical protein